MSVAKELETPELETVELDIPNDVIFPPGDLYSDEPPLESDLHLKQMILLIQCLEIFWQNRNDFYVAGNLTIYYSSRQLKSEKFRGPDFFAVLGTPDYFWFDPNSLEFNGFHLVDGEYQPLEASEQGWLWSQQLGLFLGIHQQKLRYFTPEGELIPTPQELAQQETQRANLEAQRAERLAAKLRELNIDMDNL